MDLKTENKIKLGNIEHLKKLINSGKFDEAENKAKIITKQNPNDYEAHNLLAVSLAIQKKFKEAINNFEKTIKIKNDFTEAHFNLGNALKDNNELDKSTISYLNAIKLNPNYFEAYNNLGLVFQKLKKYEDAIYSYNKAVKFKPDYLDAHCNLGDVLSVIGNYDDAVKSYKNVINIDTNHFHANFQLSIALQNLNQLHEAINCLSKVIKINPNYFIAYNNLGNIFMSLGKFEDAKINYQKAIQIKPSYALAHRHLSIVTKYNSEDKHLKKMEELISDSEIGDEEKMHLAFGLGKAYEDIKNYNKAFQNWKMGNLLRKQMLYYSQQDDIAEFINLKKIFNKEIFEKFNGSGNSDKTPIFVVGMPRSGTTLVEQILSSHSKIYGAGEIKNFVRVAKLHLAQNTKKYFFENINEKKIEIFNEIGSLYLKEIKKFSKESSYITNKFPPNFKWVGLIKLTLPNAKIINCSRNPLDNCLSIYKNYFSNALGNNWRYDLHEIGNYYNLYSDLMLHWNEIMPNFIYNIKYENLIKDQKKQIKDLLDFCNLEWDEKCIKFYENKRPVQTASATQVRKPIYKSSILSWQKYENELSPLIKIVKNYK